MSERDLPRVITLSGDMRTERALRPEITRLNRILYRPGVLMMQFGSKRRAIKCRCTALDDPERLNKDMAKYVIQFTADDPAFDDWHNKTIAIFRRTDKITGSFTLPCVFTERISDCDIINAGDVDTSPVLHILCTSSAGEDRGGTEIRNETTGETITITKPIMEGETITVDTGTAHITSDKQDGYLIDYTSDDTFLTDFKLIPGANHISVINHNAGDAVSVTCEYTNKYMEAVY